MKKISERAKEDTTKTERPTVTSRRILNERKTCEKSGFSRQTLRRKVAEASFPAPVVISKGRVGWFEHEIEAWLDSLPRAGRAA